MWTIENFKAKNFVSFEELVVFPKQGKTTFILGNNETFPSSDSNGSGKSSLLLPLRLLLTDSPENGKTRDQYIRWGQKSCDLECTLTNASINERMKIVRTYYRGSTSNKVRVFLNDSENKDLTSVNDSNAFIINKIGVPKAELLKYFVISQDNNSFFFSSTDSEKKSIIWKFTGTELLTDLDRYISDQLALLDLDLSAKNRELSKMQEQIESNEYEAETIRRSHQKNLDLVESLSRMKENLINSISAKSKKKKALELDIKNLPQSHESEELRIELEEKQETLENVSISLKKLLDKERANLKEKGKAEVMLVSKTQCPKCHHEFSISSPEIPLKEIKKFISELEESIAKTKAKIEKNKQEEKQISRTISSIKDKISEGRIALRDLKNKEGDVYDLEKEILKLKKQLEEAEEKSIEDEYDVENEIKELSKRSLKVRALSKGLEKKIQEISQKIINLKGWKTTFAKSFKAFMVNKSLAILENAINAKLKLLNFEFVIKIQGFKILKSGDVRENITIEVSNDMDNWVDFSSLSGGQKMRISLSAILAIQDILNSASDNFGGVDLLILDEMFDGLDRTGQNMAIKMLEQTGKTIFAVTHHAFDDFDSKIIIDYNNGISKVRQSGIKKIKQSG